MKYILVFIVFLGLPFNAIAGSTTGKIDRFELHSDSWSTAYNPNERGVLSIYVEGMPKSCGHENGIRRTVIYTDHPLFNSVLSVVMAAQHADQEVTIRYLDSCTARNGAWDFGYISVQE